MGRFDGLPDLPSNWLEILQAETVVMQKSMPQDPKEAATKKAQENLEEWKELVDKCPQLASFIQVSRQGLYTVVVQSGIKAEDAERFTGLFGFSDMALLRMLAVSLRARNDAG